MNRSFKLTKDIVVDIEDVSAAVREGCEIRLVSAAGTVIVSHLFDSTEEAKEKLGRISFSIDLHKRRRSQDVYHRHPAPSPSPYPYPRRPPIAYRCGTV